VSVVSVVSALAPLAAFAAFAAVATLATLAFAVVVTVQNTPGNVSHSRTLRTAERKVQKTADREHKSPQLLRLALLRPQAVRTASRRKLAEKLAKKSLSFEIDDHGVEDVLRNRERIAYVQRSIDPQEGVEGVWQ
jgi:Ribonuclease G/E